MIKVGVVGGTGYTGVELLRLLAAHPEVELAAITSRSEAGVAVAEHFPSLRGRVALAFSDPARAPLKYGPDGSVRMKKMNSPAAFTPRLGSTPITVGRM